MPPPASAPARYCVMLVSLLPAPTWAGCSIRSLSCESSSVAAGHQCRLPLAFWSCARKAAPALNESLPARRTCLAHSGSAQSLASDWFVIAFPANSYFALRQLYHHRCAGLNWPLSSCNSAATACSISFFAPCLNNCVMGSALYSRPKSSTISISCLSTAGHLLNYGVTSQNKSIFN